LMIITAWGKHKEIRKIKDFLKQYDLSPDLAEKIYRLYQNRAISLIRTNPYCMCDDTIGVSFISADKIALKMGIGENHPLRTDAVNFHTGYMKLSKNDNETNPVEQKKRIAPDRGQKRR
jgi:ATP-dependent exoDNAse (exonuclease V) alpha subunit